MSTTSEQVDAGYTLPEIVIVIVLVALCAILVIPVISSLKGTAPSPEEQLLHWLAHRNTEAGMSSLPEKICVSDNQITVYFYLRQAWRRQNKTFEAPTGATLEAECRKKETTSDRCCYLARADGFSPEGAITLRSHEQQIRYAW